MKNETKNLAVTLSYVVFAAFFACLCVFAYLNPTARSESERRPLAQFPTDISWEKIKDKTVINSFESYSVDQFPLREQFRSLKARFQYEVLRLKENNGLALQDGYLAKIHQSFTQGLIDGSLERLRYVYEKFVKDNGADAYFCLVPDKNYYLARDYGYVAPDYGALAQQVKMQFPELKYVDIFDSLSLQDYYFTDTHWRQERLEKVVQKLSSAMGFSVGGPYTSNTLTGFKGVYYGQSALSPRPEDLVYLTSDVLDTCTVYDYETGKTGSVYDLEKFSGGDGYDMYLSGTRALLRIDNPNAETAKELVIFRDSFGSSLAPLLASGYRSIYLVDIRYVMPDALPQLMDFTDKDVLFIYSALILNQKAFK